MKKTVAVIAAVTGVAMGSVASAQPMDHGKMAGMKDDHSKMPGMKGDHASMASHDFMASMKKMDQAMMMAKGKSVDATFARKMIAHHQGAIDMAKVELEHGMNAPAKQIAQKTIDENTRGIAELQAWLRDHGN